MIVLTPWTILPYYLANSMPLFGTAGREVSEEGGNGEMCDCSCYHVLRYVSPVGP